ncbi:EpsG family protein [Prevotella sp. oral taxon 376]|uniref:EpsG family protein n=1 Tax=Prevotella sp. oral taxon 376 TaxID=712466 RepID=UPI000D1E55F3|nr:EpsG family protein [Prevotella sp. oral taxon 376]PTL32777.1 EpsG family protein [Prevotella sp. oral taxon 376]
MLLYFLIFGVVIAWYLSTYNKKKKDIRLFSFFLLFLALFVGLSDMLGGYDRYIYAELFDSTADTTDFGGSYLNSAIIGYEKEFGYVLLNILLSHVTANRYIFILVLTCIIYILIFFSIREYISDYPFACILFLGLMFFFTFTYLREVIGMSVAWLSLKYIYQRNLKKFLLVMLFAFSFHNSAIIFLPMYFIPIRKYKMSHVAIIMAFLFVIGLSSVPAALFLQFGELAASEERVLYYAQEYESSGFRIEYLLEVFVFLAIIFIHYRHIPDDRKHLVFLNCSLMFCGVLLFFIRSSSGGRLGWYYMIGVIALFTEIATQHKTLNKTNLGLLALSCLLYVRILWSWGGYLYPYKTFLTDGFREGDRIHDRFEYDDYYDVDKFYRPVFRLK